MLKGLGKAGTLAQFPSGMGCFLKLGLRDLLALGNMEFPMKGARMLDSALDEVLSHTQTP
jgi:hypothetical protein